MVRIYTIIFVVILFFSSNSFSQITYQIMDGVTDTGAVVNLSSFTNMPITDLKYREMGTLNIESPETESLIPQVEAQSVFQPIYIEDPFVSNQSNGIGENTLLLDKVNVALQNNVAPPDPTIAVGPNHVIALTNNSNGFFIFDKEGNLLKSINTAQWWSAVWPEENGDPQIIYDHFAGRWVMVFMQINRTSLTSANLIAYSDDDDPFGTWFMYRLDAAFHEWPDYPQIGFDDKAIYIMSQCFKFDGSASKYTLIRIINKSELYSSNAGQLTYKDVYDITLPNSSSRPMIIHPSFQYTPSDEHYFLYASRGSGTAYAFYKLSDPIGTPILTGQYISVPFYGPTPNAVQLGSGTVVGDSISSNGSHFKTAPVFRDGFLYATHSIRNSVYPNYASIKYVKIDVATNTVVESAELGAEGYYYIYPSITVDKDHNVGIVCSRSAENEYIGSYFMTRRANDPPGLSGAYSLQEGLAKYVCSFCGTRNRWGDYLGIYLDPANDLNMWMISEYAAATNTYAVSLGEIRLNPFPGIYVFPETQDYNFGQIEVGSASDTVSALLANYGTDDLIISSIPASYGDFSLVSTHTYPITLQTYDSLVLKFVYNPNTVAVIDTVYPFINNSTNFTGIRVKATGFIINSVEEDQIYSISGPQNNGNFSALDNQTGTATNIGETGFNNLIGLAVHPKTKIAYALISSAQGSQILRVNGIEGDTYPLIDLALSNLYSMSFDSSGQLYANTQSGTIYSINLIDSSFTQISQMPAQRVSITFNHIDNELWGSVRNLVGVKDRIIKINLLSGDTTNVGQTGFGVNTNSIAFDGTGNLYGITGTASTTNNFISINSTTGVGTIVGSTGLLDLKAIAYSPANPVGIDTKEIKVPNNFALEQNYPNPFNPSTQIKFSLPENAIVKITVYNLLGEVVRELVNTDLNSGVHTVQWNSDDVSGNKVSSGIYFYELKANGISGKQFNQVRKMILMK